MGCNLCKIGVSRFQGGEGDLCCIRGIDCVVPDEFRIFFGVPQSKFVIPLFQEGDSFDIDGTRPHHMFACVVPGEVKKF